MSIDDKRYSVVVEYNGKVKGVGKEIKEKKKGIVPFIVFYLLGVELEAIQFKGMQQIYQNQVQFKR